MKSIPKIVAALLGFGAISALAQDGEFQSITEEMMRDPSPSDWLMINRTYD